MINAKLKVCFLSKYPKLEMNWGVILKSIKRIQDILKKLAFENFFYMNNIVTP